MMAKATCLVGLDVHARQTHAALLDSRTGEINVRRLIGMPEVGGAAVPGALGRRGAGGVRGRADWVRAGARGE